MPFQLNGLHDLHAFSELFGEWNTLLPWGLLILLSNFIVKHTTILYSLTRFTADVPWWIAWLFHQNITVRKHSKQPWNYQCSGYGCSWRRTFRSSLWIVSETSSVRFFIGFKATPFAKFFAIPVNIADFSTLEQSIFASAVDTIAEFFAHGKREVLEEGVLIRSANVTVQVVEILRAILVRSNQGS